MKIKKTVYMSKDIEKMLIQQAIKDNRNQSNLIEYLILKNNNKK